MSLFVVEQKNLSEGVYLVPLSSGPGTMKWRNVVSWNRTTLTLIAVANIALALFVIGFSFWLSQAINHANSINMKSAGGIALLVALNLVFVLIAIKIVQSCIRVFTLKQDLVGPVNQAKPEDQAILAQRLAGEVLHGKK